MICGRKPTRYYRRGKRIRWGAIVLVWTIAKPWMRFSIAYAQAASERPLMRLGSAQAAVLTAAFRNGHEQASLKRSGRKDCEALMSAKGLTGNGKPWMGP